MNQPPMTLIDLVQDAIELGAEVSIDFTAPDRDTAEKLIMIAANTVGRQWEEIEDVKDPGPGNWYSLINGRSDRYVVNVFVESEEK